MFKMQWTLKIFPLLILFMVFGSTVIAEGGKNFLAKVEWGNSRQMEVLKRLNPSIYAYLDDWMIVEVDEKMEEMMKERDLTYEILDREPWSLPYYLISPGKREGRVGEGKRVR